VQLQVTDRGKEFKESKEFEEFKERSQELESSRQEAKTPVVLEGSRPADAGSSGKSARIAGGPEF